MSGVDVVTDAGQPSEAPPPPPAPAPEPVSFTGTGREYFRIWIVNLALTVATLGIYSAWAKVRRLQYFYRHTRLAGAGFDYHGNPIAILKGRIVGLILLALYSTAGYFNVWVAAAIFLALAIVMPWLLVRSLRFRLHNSSYRGLRFRFHGTTAQGYWVFLAFPIFTMLSLFTLGPLWHHRLKRFQFANAAYGRTRMSFGAGAGEFYVTYVLAAFVFVALLAVMIGALLFGSIGLALTGANPEEEMSAGIVGMAVFIGLMYGAAIIAAQAVAATRIHNECWNTSRLDHVRFISRMSAPRLFGIQYTNLLATVATLGLYRPFAQVRLARYVAGTMTVAAAAAGLFSFAADESVDVTAVGEETADLFDFDIAF